MSDSLDPKVSELVEAWSAARRDVRGMDTAGFVARVEGVLEEGKGNRGPVRWWMKSSNTEIGKLGFSVGALTAILILIITTIWGGSITVPTITPVTKTFSTRIGQRTSVTLLDGSHVILAPATTLKVMGRSVDLKGEAVFTVTQHTSDPFVVKSGNTTTRVLGTTFGIRAYDENVEVAVQDGKVDANKTVLSAGDIATISSGGTMVRSNADVSAHLSWTSGYVKFRNTPVTEVLDELERWYDVRFVMADSTLKNQFVTTTLSGQSLVEMVRIMSSILDARAEQSGNVVTFHSR